MREGEDFSEFVRASQAGLLRYGSLLSGGDAHVSADLTQDALIEVGRRWRRVRLMEHPVAYTKRIMARRYGRSRSKLERERLSRHVVTDRAVDPVESPVHGAMWSALQRLPPRQRTVIVLRYYEDLSEADIAEVLGCSRGTVKSQAHRAIKALRDQLTEGQFTEEEKVNGHA